MCSYLIPPRETISRMPAGRNLVTSHQISRVIPLLPGLGGECVSPQLHPRNPLALLLTRVLPSYPTRPRKGGFLSVGSAPISGGPFSVLNGLTIPCVAQSDFPLPVNGGGSPCIGWASRELCTSSVTTQFPHTASHTQLPCI